MSKKSIDSIKHKDKKAYIPSNEEAGYEEASLQVKKGKHSLKVPKNPVVHRGQDPELFWLDKYGNDDRDDMLQIDIRSLYRHEHIAPEQLIKGLYKTVIEKTNKQQLELFSTNELFGNALERDELEKVSEYYKHSDNWTNRIIQGDSLLVMSSLLEREGMAGKIQSIYIDPPYGIKYNSNWQMKLNDRNVKDGKDEHLSGEPEMIKAYRDTWELGIHSYLSYLRDRLLIAKELLTDSGSCFVQISDENVHLVRCIMDEVFGSGNFVSSISFKTKKMALGQKFLGTVSDTILWYSKDKDNLKFRRLFFKRDIGENSQYNFIELKDGSYRRLTKDERKDKSLIPKNSKLFRTLDLHSSGRTESCVFDFEFNGELCSPKRGRSWKTNKNGIKNLIKSNRIVKIASNPEYKLFFEDYPVQSLMNLWDDTQGASDKTYVVQTSNKIIERCLLMTTDPGDLVLDSTCGSGTTAYVAEQWGRRWITIDTSRIAINIAKQRIMTAVFPYYKKHDEEGGDIRQGFQYKTVPHITLKSLANDEEPKTETLYDQPLEDRKKLRVAGPFTVETLQSFEPVSPESLDGAESGQNTEEDRDFEQRIFEHLQSAGIKNGIKNEQAQFIRIERLTDPFLHAEGFYHNKAGQEQKTYIHIGPKFGTVSRKAVNEAIKACRNRGDGDWLVILGFSFESNIQNQNITMSLGSFEVTKVRMNDDLLQEGLMKKDKKAASFMTIGEPDFRLHKDKKTKQAYVEICGLDIYDPIKDEVKERNVSDIAYWMVDDDYDGNNFIVKQVFFCGGKKNEFAKWKKSLSMVAKAKAKKNVERTLKIEIDDEAFDRLYGFKSHPFSYTKGQKIAVKVISQFGEESMKVMRV